MHGRGRVECASDRGSYRLALAVMIVLRGSAFGSDRVLVAFARFLQQASMQTHVTGRIGGEEFAVLLPGVNLAAARLFAEGARAAFASMSVDGLPDGRRFTASFGVAELEAGEGLVDLMRRADDALYRAKREGRDRVRVSNDARLSPALPSLARGSDAAPFAAGRTIVTLSALTSSARTSGSTAAGAPASSR